MKVYIEKDYDSMSRRAANIISALLILKPESVLGLATGSSPIGTYKKLVEWCGKNDLTFRHAKTVNLDEYVGLSNDDPQSYHYFMKENLFSKVDIDIHNTYLLNGLATDQEKECREYDALIESLGGNDMQLLGIGRNGHIGFNEPSDVFEKDTHIVSLTESTIQANSRLFPNIDLVPTKALSMGIGTIMKAKRILLVASGEDKADAIKNTVNGPVTPRVQASILQLHPDVTIVCDEEAASKL